MSVAAIPVATATVVAATVVGVETADESMPASAADVDVVVFVVVAVVVRVIVVVVVVVVVSAPAAPLAPAADAVFVVVDVTDDISPFIAAAAVKDGVAAAVLDVDLNSIFAS